jgi:hypothetical protein
VLAGAGLRELPVTAFDNLVAAILAGYLSWVLYLILRTP